MRRGLRELIGCGAVTSQQAARPLVASKHVPLTITTYLDNAIYTPLYHRLSPKPSYNLEQHQSTKTITMAVRNKYPFSSPPTTNAATSPSSSGSSSKPSKPSMLKHYNTNLKHLTDIQSPATSTGRSSLSTTAPPTAPKKSQSSSSPPSAPSMSNCTLEQANSVSERPMSTACSSRPATMSSSWTPTSATTQSSSLR